MNFNEEKEQYIVEPKYLDLEAGIKIDLKQDKLYKLRKTTKLVKPTKKGEVESYFDKLDHYSIDPSPVLDNFEETSFMTDELLDEIIEETWTEG